MLVEKHSKLRLKSCKSVNQIRESSMMCSLATKSPSLEPYKTRTLKIITVHHTPSHVACWHFLKTIYLLVHVLVSCLNICLYQGARFPGTGDTDSCELWCRWWKSNLDLLEEPSKHLTTESPFQPLFHMPNTPHVIIVDRSILCGLPYCY